MANEIKIPQNLVPVFDAVSKQTGIPIGVLAAVIQTQIGGFPNTLQGGQIVQVGQALARGGGTGDPYDPNWRPDWPTVAAEVFGNASSGWTKRFNDIYGPKDIADDQRWIYDSINPSPTGTYHTPDLGGGIGSQKITIGSGAVPLTGERSIADIQDIYTLFQQDLGRLPKDDAEAIGWGRLGQTIGAIHAELLASQEGQTYRQNETAIKGASGWVNGAYQRLLGRPATNSEIITITQNGWNPGQLDTYLKAQPYGTTGATVGQASDLRTAINRSFQSILGRDATEGEINFAVVNKIPTNHTDALAEQTKSGTVWAGDPEKFTTTRKALQQVMAGYGIIVPEGQIDTNLVNQAINGKWTADQMKQSIASGQYPGAPQGTTVDRYTTTKQIADNIWQSLYPNAPQSMRQTYMTQFLNMSPDQITSFIGAMPSQDALKVGMNVPISVYNAAKNAANQQLAAIGIVGREPTPEEISHFATSKSDAEAIRQQYATSPEIQAINPGAQYGLKREDYYNKRSQLETAYSKNFATPDTLAAVQDKAKNPTPGIAPQVSPWEEQVFKSGMSPEQAQQAFGQYFRNNGAAPTADDLAKFQARIPENFSQDYSVRSTTGSASVTDPVKGAGGEPVFPGLKKPTSSPRP